MQYPINQPNQLWFLLEPLSDFSCFDRESSFPFGSSPYGSNIPPSDFLNAVIEVMVKEKSPSWVPKKLCRSARLLEAETGTVISPSHHQADSFDILQVQWFCIFLFPSSVCWREIIPLYKDLTAFLVSIEVIFPADSTLFPAIRAFR